MKKRIISMLLAAMMMVGTFTGCGNKTEDVSGDGQTLTIGIPQSANVTSYDENALTKYIEQSLDINLKFVYFNSSSENYLQQLTLMASSNESMPDVLWGFSGMDNNTRNEFGDAGYFLDLTDLIDKYAPNYKAQFEKLTEKEQKRITNRGTSDSGHFYSMPLYSMQAVDDLQNMMFINQTWLDKVGMSAPTSVDELYNVLKAFKEQDPNGNGKADEIPLFGTAGLGMNVCDYVINAYVYYDTNNEFNVTDGKLWAPFTTDEYREAVIFLNKLCKEGLLSELSFSVTSTTEQIALHTPANNTALVGIWQGHPSLATDKSSPLVADYVALGSLGDATGKGGYTVIKPNTLSWCSFITKDCKNPELAMKLLDFFYADETVTRVRHGEKDVDWKEAEGTNIYGTASKFNVINSDVFFKGDRTWCINGNAILTYDNYIAGTETTNEADKENTRLTQGLWDIMKDAKTPEKLVRELTYTAEEYESRSEYNAMIKQHIVEARNYFILGTKDPSNDADWQQYLNDLEKLGLPEYMKIMQTAYDRQ